MQKKAQIHLEVRTCKEKKLHFNQSPKRQKNEQPFYSWQFEFIKNEIVPAHFQFQYLIATEQHLLKFDIDEKYRPGIANIFGQNFCELLIRNNQS